MTNIVDFVKYTKDKVVAVEAFAGTGKTFSIIEMANSLVSHDKLYIVFGNQLAKNPKIKSIPNTDCFTFHKLAFNKIGFKYHDAGKISKLKPHDVLKACYLDKSTQNIEIAIKTVRMVNEFCHSENPDIESFVAELNKDDRLASRLNFNIAADCAIVYWNKIIDLNNNFQISPDVFLKLFQTTGMFFDYDYVFFDEAQDGNPLMKSIIENSIKKSKKLKKVVLVGDKHQSIFSFRKSVNLFDEIEFGAKYTIKESHRYGQNIAKALNAILKTTKKEENNIVSTKTDDIYGKIDYSTKYVVIARSKAILYRRAATAIQDGKKIAFLDNLSDPQVNIILDIERLKNNKKHLILSDKIKAFRDITTMLQYYKNIGDTELVSYIKLVNSYRGDMKKFMEIIRNGTTSLKNADVLFTTAHKSKGLTFSQVELANDFYDPFERDGLLKKNIKEEEMNILYVAASRAKDALKPNKVLSDIYEFAIKNDYNLDSFCEKINKQKEQDNFRIDFINKNNKFNSYSY